MYKFHEKRYNNTDKKQRWTKDDISDTGRRLQKDGNRAQMCRWCHIYLQCPKELACAVVLFEKKTGKQAAKIDVLPQYRVGSVRSVTIYPLKAEKYYYCYEIEGKRVRDPYGERVIGREKWGDTERTLDDALLSGFKKEGFDWSEDVSVEIPANEMVMYKLHVRGFSMDGRGRNKGTFAAVMDRLSYLKELGITTLECMPVYEFEELMENGRLNYWGYAPSDYFAVKSSYASQKDADWEFKSLILETHKQQMELIMEMHFVPEQTAGAIIEILRYWVMEYHVDGFKLFRCRASDRRDCKRPISDRNQNIL